jgi:S-adenosylmethionine synthetase
MIYRTSEWVSPGHPDKVADCISEYILDRLLEIDPDVRYALEVQIKGVYVNLAGEITTKADVVIGDYIHWAKEAVNKIGYTREYQQKWGKENTICGDDLIGSCNITQQSSEIACGVNTDGYGDQGIFTGYAERFNPAFMPKDKEIAREIGLMLYNNALDGNIGGLDIKTQVTLDESDRLVQLIVAVPVLDDEEYKLVQDSVMKKVYSLFTSYQLSMSQIIINGTGIYKQHGPIADSGTTGRKLAVDFYGNNAPIGGGSPWTKDGTKADLVLNLYARQRALQELKEHTLMNAHHCVYQLCCCIGRSNLIGTYKVYDDFGVLVASLSEELDIKPSELIEKYGLKKPIFFDLCKNGLFEDDEYAWNKG